MRDNDLEKFMVEMCRMWPGKFQDDELRDMHQRLRKFSVGDVLAVANEHKNTSKFTPRVSELFARLKGKEVRDPDAAAPERSLSVPDAIRKHNPHLVGRSDAEAILRYWRAQWVRYSTDANTRFEKVPDVDPFRGILVMARRQAAGFRDKCRTGCAGALVACNVPSAAAWRRSASIFSPPDDFKATIIDLRDNGIEPLPDVPDFDAQEQPDLVPVFAEAQ